MRPILGSGAKPLRIAPMSRPPTGSALVQRLEGSDEAKRKTQIILDTISGTLAIDDAAAQLGINRAYVFVLRDQILLGAIAAAEPRKPGPKPASATSTDSQDAAQADAKRAKDAEIALELERSRQELALVLGSRMKKKRHRDRP